MIVARINGFVPSVVSNLIWIDSQETLSKETSPGTTIAHSIPAVRWVLHLTASSLFAEAEGWVQTLGRTAIAMNKATLEERGDVQQCSRGECSRRESFMGSGATGAGFISGFILRTNRKHIMYVLIVRITSLNAAHCS